MEPQTEEQIWLDFLAEAPVWQAAPKSTVIVSPHPDDETLGAGGLIAMQRRKDIEVSLLAVTDGEAAYSDFPGLGDVRRGEQESAAESLGIHPEHIFRFSLPDSRVTEFEAGLIELLEERINEDTLLVAPWPVDPHPDHEACGRAAAKAGRSKGAALIYYVFWTWHRKTPEALEGLPLRRLEIPQDLQERKAHALACHSSQLEAAGSEPILSERLLAPARRSFETFIIYD